MKTATNKRPGRKPVSGGMFTNAGSERALTTPEGRALLARLDAATCEFFPHRERHIRQVALVVLKARGV